MTSLSNKDIEEFWIRVYLNPKSSLREAAIDRAYRDFNRTLHGIGKDQTDEKQSRLKKEIDIIVSSLLDLKFVTQLEFDTWHEEKCKSLIKAYDEVSNYKMFVGQAQKWINMTLKYLFALGEERVGGISVNYRFFHFPLDKIIQDKFLCYGVSKLKLPWSRIDSYDEYLDYQKCVRVRFPGQIPLDVEFRLFNEFENATNLP